MSYPWSSLTWYLAAGNQRPGWLRVDRLLGEYRLSRDTPEARRQFQAALERLRASEAKAENESYAEIRRGWCFGSDGFRQELLEKHGDATGEHHTREIARENEQSRAERIIRGELAKAGWKDTHLDERPKNDPVKLELGARLRRETTWTMKQIAKRLSLGTPRSATTALHRWMRIQPTAKAGNKGQDRQLRRK